VRTKRIYRRTAVKKISLAALNELASEKGRVGTSVGLDISKEEIVAVVRWSDSSFEAPWSVKNPAEILELVTLLKALADHCDSLTIGLESTGTYGEAVRYAMTEAKLEVHRISGKAACDYQEIFDGVPSQHDGKDAAIIAELTGFGKGTAWPYEAASEVEQEIAHQVRRLDAFRKQATQWIGRLEALLTLHWPELHELLDLKRSTLIQCMIHYGCPKRLLADPKARQNLRRWGRAGLSDAKIESLLETARNTRGVPAGASAVQWTKEVASELHGAMQEVKACEKRLEAIAAEQEGIREFVEDVGAVTLCVIWATVGDPVCYGSSGAFLKALGLNLKERSSGKRNGQLAITKRGPSLARKYLYFWAMRSVNRPELRPWYETFQKVGKGRATEYRKMKGLIAMMRKLCRALWYCRQHDKPFEYEKVFPGGPLEKRKRQRRTRAR
jgi:transposase